MTVDNNFQDKVDRLLECESLTEFKDIFPKLTNGMTEDEVVLFVWRYGSGKYQEGFEFDEYAFEAEDWDECA